MTPRETMRVLPGWLQPLLTWITGMPLPEEQPLIRWTPVGRLFYACGFLAFGVLTGVLIWNAGGTYLIAMPLSWLMTVSGMRDLYAVIEHYAIHHLFAKSVRANRLIAEIISTALIAAPYAIYRRDHLRHHEITREDDDPDVIFLKAHGFRPGMGRRAFLNYVLWRAVSPEFHARYFLARLRMNLTGTPYRSLAAACFLVLLLLLLAWTNLWLPVTVIWLVPLLVLFQVASLLNYHSEHRWLLQRGRLRRRVGIARACVGRFAGDPCPPSEGRRSARFLQWTRWWLRLILIHLPNRLFILVGDQSQHDLHHRNLASDWCNAAFARRDDIAAGAGGWAGEPYIDVWGSMLDHLAFCIEEPEKRAAAAAE